MRSMMWGVLVDVGSRCRSLPDRKTGCVGVAAYLRDNKSNIGPVMPNIHE